MVALGLAVALSLGALIGWAARTLSGPMTPPLESSEFTYAVVRSGEVGAELTLNATARWGSRSVGVNRAAGVVTSLNARAGQSLSSGDELFRVNLRPVVIAEGDTPSFRDLSLGAKGPDVTQVQALLREQNLLPLTPEPGLMDSTSVAAVRRWQQSLGLAVDGVVRAADVVFVPRLPARIVVDESVQVGGSLSGGERIVSALDPEPAVRVEVTVEQAELIPEDAAVTVSSPNGRRWRAQVGERTLNARNQSVNLILTGRDGRSVCGGSCAEIAAGKTVVLAARITLTPRRRGLVVPTAALRTEAGFVSVVDDKGVEHPVDVVVSAEGLSVVTGVDEGVEVRVPGELSTAAGGSTP